MKRRRYTYGGIFLLAFLICVLIVDWDVQRNGEIAKHNLNSLLVNQQVQLTNEVSNTINQVYLLRSIVLGSNGKPEHLAAYGDFLYSKPRTLRNVLLAKNGKVNSIYPLQGNEAALGLNLLGSDNASSAEAISARNSGEIVLTGPFKLMQGGQALSARLAVYVPGEKGEITYWGLVSVTMDYPKVFADKALDYLKRNNYAYRLSKKEGANLIPLLSNQQEKLVEPEGVTFNFYNMTFFLEAAPIHGWYDYNRLKWGGFASFVIAFLISYTLGSMMERSTSWQEKARRDPLTGLYNRSAAFYFINQLLASPVFEKGAFIILDMDDFKTVNDVYGHQIGDKLLSDFAKTLKENCRESDIIGRLGGDEFIVFMAFNSSDDFLQPKLERLYAALKNKIEYQGKSMVVTSSMGVSLTEKAGKDVKELYRKADEALYKAKESDKQDIHYAE